MWEENHTTLKNNQELMHMVAENPAGVWIANRKLWWWRIQQCRKSWWQRNQQECG